MSLSRTFRSSLAFRRAGLPRGCAAFTLVELLVVIAIIAVLIALLLPVLKKAKEASNRIVCQTNIRQLAAACLMYREDNRGHFPNARRMESDPSQTHPIPGRYADWVKPELNRRLEDSAIAKYLSGHRFGAHSLRKVLVCPSDAGRRRTPFSYPATGPYWPSYAIHEQLIDWWGTRSSLRFNKRFWIHKIMLVEVNDPLDGIWNVSSQAFVGSPPHPRSAYEDRLSRAHGTTFHSGLSNIPGSLQGRIAANASVAFFDGHVEAMDDWNATASHYRLLNVPINAESGGW